MMDLTIYIIIILILFSMLLVSTLIAVRLKLKNNTLMELAAKSSDTHKNEASLSLEIGQSIYQSKEHLQDLLSYVDAAFWTRDMKSGKLVVSLGLENIFGLSEVEFQDDPELWKKIIHQEDLDRVRRTLLKEGQERVKVDYRIMKNNGEIRWLHLSSTPIFNKDGHSGKVMGILIDITELKQTEEKLKESKQHYRILQESLDHFSQDLFKVMKVSDLEDRLIIELKGIFGLTDGIYILEIDERLNLYRCTGGTADLHESVLQSFDETAPIGKIAEFEHGAIVKIGETNSRIIVLCIESPDTITDIIRKKVWLQTLSRYVSVLYENLFKLEDLAKELERSSKDKQTPGWIPRLLFLLSEKERGRLSADLHDSVLQNQILWYRKLQTLRAELKIEGQMEKEFLRIEEGLLDVIRQIRFTCNELRPPYLKELGLIKALEGLFVQTGKVADFEIKYDFEGLHHELSEEEMITIYRVAQELLANARKHSNATKVEFTISSIDDTIYFSYSDNGIGMILGKLVDSFDHIGLSGIKKRVDSIEGEVEIYSSPGKGVNLLISIPKGVKKSLNSKLFEVFE
ncbi:sensor histidine kinase [Bacillus sp. B-jedd]|uniref:sensor histidine kinase n=1 Tax=Bacillus sp. B-jedd TaxID=1476857 RepID=UPI0005156518|nr:PAS domain-containing protein [Bacillus sp. B-jedd]CEG25932.1 sensor protein comp [Bacillus sp. B-jedd]